MKKPVETSKNSLLTQRGAKSVNGTTPPPRKRNLEVRTREYLTEAEIDQLRKHAGFRDSLLILMAFRHALRVKELCLLEWRDVLDLNKQSHAALNVRRVKGSRSGVHPLEPDEVAGLRRLRKERPHAVYVFESNRGDRLSPAGFRKMLARLAAKAGLGALKAHPHMLRHSTGHALASDTEITTRELGELMGHANLNNTMIYTSINPERFRGIWRRHR